MSTRCAWILQNGKKERCKSNAIHEHQGEKYCNRHFNAMKKKAPPRLDEVQVRPSQRLAVSSSQRLAVGSEVSIHAASEVSEVEEAKPIDGDSTLSEEVEVLTPEPVLELNTTQRALLNKVSSSNPDIPPTDTSIVAVSKKEENTPTAERAQAFGWPKAQATPRRAKEEEIEEPSDPELSGSESEGGS